MTLVVSSDTVQHSVSTFVLLVPMELITMPADVTTPIEVFRAGS